MDKSLVFYSFNGNDCDLVVIRQSSESLVFLKSWFQHVHFKIKPFGGKDDILV